jgi:hypothetical protein
MQWNWLCDKATHEQLRSYWDKGLNINADYFTKHHAPSHHRDMRPKYVLNANQLTAPLQHLGARVCSNPGCYTAVNFHKHLEASQPPMVAMLATQSRSPHNLLS